jgi:hypothetical protein
VCSICSVDALGCRGIVVVTTISTSTTTTNASVFLLRLGGESLRAQE